MRFLRSGVTAAFVLSMGMVHAADVTVESIMDGLKSHLDLGFKQQDKVKKLVQRYIELLNNFRAKPQDNPKVLAVQIMMLNQQFEDQLKMVLTPEQMNAFNSIKRSILAPSTL